MQFHLLLVVLAITLHASLAKTDYCPPQESTTPCYCAHGLFYGGNGTRVVCNFIADTQTLVDQVQRLRGYSIDYFFLSFSNLSIWPSGLFQGTTIKRINIQSTNLERLHESRGPFDGLEDSLEELTIQFVANPSKWFWSDIKNLKRLKSVEIYSSPMDFVGHVFAEIGSLETIAVSFSNVNRIHPQAFPELTNLRSAIFTGNNIPYLVRTMFPNPAPKLEVLNFGANKLFTLNDNMFENMPALKYVDFSQNEFKSFESKPFLPVWNQLGTFYMAYNPFRCDCSLIPLQQKLLSGSYPPYQDLERINCRNPGDKKETNLRDLDAESMHC